MEKCVSQFFLVSLAPLRENRFLQRTVAVAALTA
jgi:hypothetical protein